MFPDSTCANTPCWCQSLVLVFEQCNLALNNYCFLKIAISNIILPNKENLSVTVWKSDCFYWKTLSLSGHLVPMASLQVFHSAQKDQWDVCRCCKNSVAELQEVIFYFILFFCNSQNWGTNVNVDFCWSSGRQLMSFSGFSRSSASVGHCSGRIGLGAHHFRHFQFPYLQVSLPMSLVLGGLLVVLLLRKWHKWNCCFLRGDVFESGFMGLARWRAPAVIFTQQLPQQVVALKQRGSQLDLPNELVRCF